MFDDLPEPGPTAGPPSLPMQAAGRGQGDLDFGGSRRAPNSPAPIPVTTTRKPATVKPKAAAKTRAPSGEEPESIVESAAGWKKVRAGLFWARLGIFLALLPAGAYFGVAIYCFQESGDFPKNVRMKGYLDKGLSLWQEIQLAAVFGGGLLGYLLVMLGRKGCTRVPSVAKTKGMASGTLFLTFLAFLSFAAYGFVTVSPIFLDKKPIPAEYYPLIEKISWMSFIYVGLLAEAWFLLFCGQAGIALNNQRIVREIAVTGFMIVGTIIGVLIANEFYPLTLNPLSPKYNADKELETYLIQAGIYFLVSVLFVFRSMSIIGMLRRSIRNWFEDNQQALAGAA